MTLPADPTMADLEDVATLREDSTGCYYCPENDAWDDERPALSNWRNAKHDRDECRRAGHTTAAVVTVIAKHKTKEPTKCAK